MEKISQLELTKKLKTQRYQNPSEELVNDDTSYWIDKYARKTKMMARRLVNKGSD